MFCDVALGVFLCSWDRWRGGGTECVGEQGQERGEEQRTGARWTQFYSILFRSDFYSRREGERRQEQAGFGKRSDVRTHLARRMSER